MSRYRGPCLKKIRCLGALAGLTNKRPKAGSDLRNQLRFEKKIPISYSPRRKQKLRFQYGLIEHNYLNTFVSSERQRGLLVQSLIDKFIN